ncbi:hypothetical protein SK128_009012 [Halocaridina rubra]|uniref:SKICH domain-containing protein n=1 Tax=Halocaridina rubra TaxID=373956 RepID=A0AAN9A634_HALRR
MFVAGMNGVDINPIPFRIMSEPMTDEDKPKRDCDEVSVASDFSIIPESFVVQEDVSPSDRRMASSLGSCVSDHFQPSSSAEMSFGKVWFQNIQATYTADSDIAVSYVLTPSVSAKSSDRIALYRVGFGSPQDYLTYQWAPTPSKDHTSNQLPLTVVFKASSLPKYAGEFFQFCYVTHECQIVGVSTPFQLHPVGSLGANNVCDVDDGEDGMVVVCTKESVLHDNINRLKEDNAQLTLNLNSARSALEEKQRELDDRFQQLTMCQHHLQALETKMKKETSEKCELMGRVGQVVEEKGHLEDRVKTLEKNLDTSANQVETLGNQVKKLTEEQNAGTEEMLHLRKHREQLEHALQKCQGDLKSAEDKVQSLNCELDKTRAEREKAIQDLEFWTSSAAADKNEKNSLALKFSTVNEELICKLEELEKSKRLVSELEEALATAVVDMTTIKDNLKETEEKLAKAEEERSIHEERQNVVNQDNEQLKATIQQLKNKIKQLEDVQENEDSGREAAERIASDLSGRLQTAKAEYHTLALTNIRLVKKLKKLRQSVISEGESGKASSMSASVLSQGSSWLAVDEGGIDNEEDFDEAAAAVASVEVPPNMIQSYASILTSCSNCSHSTQQLSEAVHRKMEDIVRELSLQIQSLKSELKAREKEQETYSKEGSSLDRSQEKQSIKDEHQSSMENKVEEQHQQTESTQNIRQSLEAGDITNHPPQTEAGGETPGDDSSETQVLYSNSFLHAPRTAPVFLPERLSSPNLVQDSATGGVRPSSPSPTPSMLSQRGHSVPPVIVTSSPNGHSLVAPQPHPQSLPDIALPPPLLPETTTTARQAAVMSQFSNPQIQGGMGHESDDDDFHSTSDTDDNPSLTQYSSSRLYECPMCGLVFQAAALRLLEEHINSHLEHVCPVCSMAFQRNDNKRFEAHVQEHFKDEGDDNEDPLDDPSGPWGPAFRAARLLEID